MNVRDCARRGSRLLAASILASLLVAVPRLAMAEDAGGPAAVQSGTSGDAVSAGDEFSKQIEELKGDLAGLNKKIDDSAKALDATTDVDKARKDIEDLRASVSVLLGAVADNGPVAQLGAGALKRAKDKLAALDHDTRFTAQERQFLIDRWRELDANTQQATQDLDKARGRLVELLRVLQTNEDFIDELVQIRQHEKALEVIRDLTNNIRNASDDLKRLIGAIRPPGV